MVKPSFLCIFFLFGLSFFFCSYCQNISDSVFYNNAFNNVKAAYFTAIKEKSLLYNGSEYESFGHGANGTQFFIADSMFIGSVFYDGLFYEHVPLQYDMVNDALITKYFADNNTLQLVKNKIEYFSVENHHFISLNEQNTDGFSGFYELLYNNKKVLVLAKREKQLKLALNAEDRSSAFVQYNQYFVYANDKYYPVNSEDDLVKIFHDKATEIKKFIRTKKLKYKQNAEQTILAAVLFYDGLTS